MIGSPRNLHNTTSARVQIASSKEKNPRYFLQLFVELNYLPIKNTICLQQYWWWSVFIFKTCTFN